MSDRIAVMNRGKVEQVAAPEDIYKRPATAFVADFVGETNMIAGKIVSADGRRVTLETANGATFSGHSYGSASLAPGAAVQIVVRPESILFAPPQAAFSTVTGEVEEVTFSGATARVSVKTTSGGRMQVSVPAGQSVPAEGESVSLTWADEAAVVV